MKRPFEVEFGEKGEYAFITKDEVLYEAFLTAGANGGMNCFVIPDGVKEIAEYCLNFLMSRRCVRYLSKVVIPKSVEKIHPCAFFCSGGIDSFEVDPLSQHFKAQGKFLLSKNGKRLICYGGEGHEDEIIVPDGVEIIEENVFRNSSSDLLVIPESVKEIATQYYAPIWGESIFAKDIETIVIKSKDVVFTDGKGEMLQFAKLIKAPAGSTAIEYAKENDIGFEEI